MCDIYHNNDHMSPATPLIQAVPKNLPSFFKSKSLRIALIAVILLVIASVLYTVVFKARPFGPKAPTVKLETEYKNPFNRNTQYANPFDEYKNPFASL